MDNIWDQSELVLFLKMQREKILINKTVTRESTPFRDNLMLRKNINIDKGKNSILLNKIQKLLNILALFVIKDKIQIKQTKNVSFKQ